ncbi:MAG: M50 family metallopeptidase [Microgenomates group bacterium]|nr:M50 family metallopeptidase [Candidatus Woesebacteria bacterium]MBP6882965.1 M50 family metallopeptidase [Candidatus Woesebacteria bacterium]
MTQVLLFLILCVALFFLSRKTIHTCFYFFSRFLKHPQAAYRMIALLYFPGTAIHEMSHLVMAMILNLKVRDITLIPKVRGNTLKLGTVTYEKRDVVRGLMVGIAPFFAALFAFWLIDAFKLLYINYWSGALFSYIVFTISSTMFSSKQDLIDLVYVIPIIVVIGVVLFVLKIDVKSFLVIFDVNLMSQFFSVVNSFLIFSLLLNGGMIVVLKLILRVQR